MAGGHLPITDGLVRCSAIFRYDLQADQTITDGLGLRYQDDCFMMDVTYQRSFIRDQDIEPDERFLVNFTLKYLGSY